MVPGSVIDQFQCGIGLVTIRYPQLEDAPGMMDYINQLSSEQTFITLQGEQKTLQDEESWLSSILDGMSNSDKVMLVASINQRIVGIANVERGSRVESHIAELGISVSQDVRNQGLGSRLFELINQQADQHLPNLRIVMLGVFANNPRAIHVYQRHGFTEYGRLPGGILHRGEYVDHLYMYRPVTRS